MKCFPKRSRIVRFAPKQDGHRTLLGWSKDYLWTISGRLLDAKRAKAGWKVGCFCTELGQKTVRRGPLDETGPVTWSFFRNDPHRPILANLI